VFISSPDPESARGLIQETRELAAGYGRDPYDVKFFQGLSLVVGRTSDEAREKEAQIEELSSIEGVLCHILGDAGIDAGALPLDTPISELGEFRGIQGWLRSAEDAAGGEATIADLGRAFERSSRIVGSPTEIADKLEQWRDAGIDGVNVFHAVRPGTFKDIAELLISMKAPRWRIFLVARLPSALPYFFAGFRISITYAVVGAIFAEYAGAAKGLGIYILIAKNNFRPDLVLAAVFLSACLTLALFSATVLLGYLAMPWARIRKEPSI